MLAKRPAQKSIVPQTGICGRLGRKVLNKLQDSQAPACFVCQENPTGQTKRGSGPPKDSCRFRDFRTFYLCDSSEFNSERIAVNEFVSIEFHDNSSQITPILRLVCNTKRDVEAQKSILSRLLVPILEAESAHASHPDIFRKRRETTCRATCDVCFTSLFSSSWMCQTCGRDLCRYCYVEGAYTAMECQKNIGLDLFNHKFRPVTRFGETELQDALLDARLTSMVKGDISALMPASTLSVSDRGEMKFTYDFPEESFRKLWSNGVPLVIMGVNSHLQSSWKPEYFIAEYGEVKCIIEETSTSVGRESTVADFFSSFGVFSESRPVERLKDWPPTADFKSVFPVLYADFMAAVPMKEYTHADGALNLASNFPRNIILPDLGPKMYIALEDRNGQGSTRLHMDLSDAVNVLVHSSKSSTGAEGGALWHIFSREDTIRLSTILMTHPSYNGTGHPIHQQTIYLSPADLEELSRIHGIVPYTTVQRLGQSLFVPAGSAHQVGNLSDCIKVACDFVSIPSVETCFQLREQFRKERHEDVLQLETMLWYSWLSVCRGVAQQPQPDCIEPPTAWNYSIEEHGEVDQEIPIPMSTPTGSALNSGSQTYSQPTALVMDENQDWKKEQVLKRKLKKASEKAEKQRKLDDLSFKYVCPHPICKGSGRLFDGADQFVHHAADKHSVKYFNLHSCVAKSNTIEEFSKNISKLLGL